MDRYSKYNEKCKCYHFRFRKGKDDEYIRFMDNCPNKVETLRKMIDLYQHLSGT